MSEKINIPSLEKNETIRLTIKTHPIVFVAQWVYIVWFFIFSIVIFHFFVPIASLVSEGLFWFFFGVIGSVFIYFLVKQILQKMTQIYLVTNKQCIIIWNKQQKINSFNLEDIQKIQSYTNGFLWNILWYWTLEIELKTWEKYSLHPLLQVLKNTRILHAIIQKEK